MFARTFTHSRLTHARLALSALAVFLSSSHVVQAQSLTTSFTYQGELSQSSTPANGTFDLQFRAFDAANAGAQVGPTLCVNDVLVANGRFTSSLDFGGIFGGQRLFLEVQVRDGALGTCADAPGYTTLSPRQELAATPYATYAVSAAQASTLGGQPRSFFQNASNLTTGTISDARLTSNVARVNAASNTFTGTLAAPAFVGTLTGNASSATLATNASALNNQSASFYTNAGNLSTGVLADARLSANVPLLDALRTFSAGIEVGGVGFVAQNPNASTAKAELAWLGDKATLRVLGSGVGAASGLTIATRANANAMQFDDAGNVGVGVASPSHKLDVNGSIRSRSGGVIFPDGSTQVSAQKSANQTGIMVPIAAQRLRISVGGVSTNVTMKDKFTVGFTTGEPTEFTLLRPLSTDATWRNAAVNATSLVVAFEVFIPATNTVVVSYTFVARAPKSWSALTSDLGGVYESLSFEYPQVAGNPHIPARVLSTPSNERAPEVSFQNQLPTTIGVDTRLRIGTTVRTEMTPLTSPVLTPQLPPNTDLMTVRMGYVPTSTANLWAGAVTVPQTAFSGRLVFEQLSGSFVTLFTSSPTGCIVETIGLMVADDGVPIEFADVKMSL